MRNVNELGRLHPDNGVGPASLETWPALAGSDVVVVAGARPNFVKIAPIVRALVARGIPTRILHTGQHYDRALAGNLWDELGLPEPDVCLNVGSGSHGEQTARALAGCEVHFHEMRPAGVVVVGDVNSTFAAALAAVKLGIRVAHVEAGLRSFDFRMPEEVNRRATDAISQLLFVSEPSGVENLLREGIPCDRIVFAGNVMIDTLVHERDAARALNLRELFGVQPGEYFLSTVHRPSNVDDPAVLDAIVRFWLDLASLARRVVVPVHPRTAAKLTTIAKRQAWNAGVVLIPPVSYRQMLALMDGAIGVVTDSGGVQEETTFLGVPCLTLRERTERPVTVSRGTNTVVGHDWAAARAWAQSRASGGRGGPVGTIPGWDGYAADRIADRLARAWNVVPTA